MKIKHLHEGLNAQQRSVPQLPAQAHAKKIKVLGAKTDPKHPFAGYMVGADESVEEQKHQLQWTVEQHTNGHHNAFYLVKGHDTPREVWKDARGRSDFKNRSAAEDKAAELNGQGIAEAWSQKYKSSINCSHPKGFSQRAHCAGKKKHTESVEMEMVCESCGMCKTHGNITEIKKGQKDSNGYTSCWTGYHAAGTKKSATTGKQVRNCVPNESVEEMATPPAIKAKNRAAEQTPVKEAVANEDVLSALKSKLGDLLLQTLGREATDSDLKDKPANQDNKEVNPIVKKITTDDGHEICIHGNEDDGFRISVKNKHTPSQFDSLDEAVMACEMYCNHRRKQALTADYVDEA